MALSDLYGVCVCFFIPWQSVPVWSLSSTAKCFLVRQKPSPGRRACRLRHRSLLRPAPPGKNTIHCNCCYAEKIQSKCSGPITLEMTILYRHTGTIYHRFKRALSTYILQLLCFTTHNQAD